MNPTTRDTAVPAAPTPAHSRRRELRALVDRLRRRLRERWDWYRQQQREDQERHWWDVYNR